MKKISLIGIASAAVAGAMASGQLYLVTKDGKSIAYPIENVDSVTFSEPGKIKSLSLENLIKKAALADSLEKALSECQGVSYAKYAGVYRLPDKSLLCIYEDGKAEWLNDLGKGTTDNILRVNVTFMGADYDPAVSIYEVNDSMRVSYKYNAWYTSPYDAKTYTSTYNMEALDGDRIKLDDNICFKAMSLAQYKTFRDSVLAMYEPVFTEGEKHGNGYVVDLGLPSGLKWATWNIGASKVDDYGSYYTWAEVKTKNEFSVEDYFTKSLSMQQQKEAGIIDSLRNLTSKYDAATVNWGEEWRMPNSKEYEELIKNCKFYWTRLGTTYGMKVVGPNGNKIFLPAGGMIGDDGYYQFNQECIYWTSTLSNSSSLSHVPAEHFWSHYQTTSRNQSNPYYGKSIRAVAVEPEPGPYAKYAGVYRLSNNSLLCIYEDGKAEWLNDLGKGRADNNMVKVDVTFKGADYDSLATIFNANDTLRVSYKWHGWYLSPSEDKEYTSTLTLEALDNDRIKIGGETCKKAMSLAQYESFRDSVLTVYEPVFTEGEKHGKGYMVDLGLPSGLKWASWNIGASKVNEYGSYYTWGEVKTKETFSSDDYFTRTLSGEEQKAAGIIDDQRNLTSQYDAATVNWGEDWRMPSRKEYVELIENCKFYWTRIDNIYGMKVVGPNGNKIFLPAGGSIGENGYYMFNLECIYWTSSLYNGSYSSHVPAEYFWSHYITTSWNQSNPYYGELIRAVAVEK